MIRFVLILAILLAGCDSSGSNDAPDPASIQKSPKRGLAYNLTHPADFDALKEGVSWWYNWHFETSAASGYETAYQMDFIPMLWGGDTSDSDMARVKAFILAHPDVEYLLVMNEPNLRDQADRTPAQAATDWVRYEQVVAELAAQGRDIKIVGPAMTWGTMLGYADPVRWMDDFLAYYRAANDGRDPQIDYLAFHWYDYGLESQLDRLAKYGKPIWVTEMANWNSQINSYDKQAEQMRHMVAMLESRNDVFRYAWFIGRGFDGRYTNLLNDDPGALSALGEQYVSLPY